MIEFHEVSKFYPGGFSALKDINFRIDKGEMVFLVGHSGAGKTTLLNLMAAIDLPTKGSVSVNGQQTSRLGRRGLPFLRRNLGMIFQDHKLLFDRSVFDNVLLPMYIAGFEPQEAERRARAALDKVGLLKREKDNPVTLSGGEQQRLCIARAIVNRPTILLADEPTGNLDQAYANTIMDMFASFNQVGVTVIIATHDEYLIPRYRPRVLRLAQGELLG